MEWPRVVILIVFNFKSNSVYLEKIRKKFNDFWKEIFLEPSKN